ncbi:hypothetical protein BA1DRAFT_03147 [Photorhabdus aegyptia]|uniref:Uncharacterized protein n=1 Tax=Photorhabdus aegyptia TaxID=2805098 RepID=A0A022PFH8_9GAMM|nr:hypothetical protein BA1DRAFT_03147 [Photorhabdus aegyptia]
MNRLSEKRSRVSAFFKDDYMAAENSIILSENWQFYYQYGLQILVRILS